LQDWDPAGAYQHLTQVQASRPIVDYYQSMATVLVAERKFSAALYYLETALQLDPFSEINYHLQGFVYYAQEQFADAVESFDRSIELKANFSISTLYRGQALLCQGRAAEALAFFERLPADEPGDILRLGGTTLAYAALGDTERAQAGIRQLETHLETDLVERALSLLILCTAVGGQRQEALDYIERGIALHLPLLIYLPVEPLLEPLRAIPRFRELMGQILEKPSDFAPPERQYQQLLFTPEELTAYEQQLTQLMAEEQPFLDPALTLRGLAERLALPTNHLSQLLNAGLGQNFAEFVNSYRLEAFKARVADPANRHLTLLGLAFDSGFNSKTVFNTFFKKKMGKTPRAYWKEVVEE
jgi:AraC-like DNA-binding protein